MKVQVAFTLPSRTLFIPNSFMPRGYRRAEQTLPIDLSTPSPSDTEVIAYDGDDGAAGAGNITGMEKYSSHGQPRRLLSDLARAHGLTDADPVIAVLELSMTLPLSGAEGVQVAGAGMPLSKAREDETGEAGGTVYQRM